MELLVVIGVMAILASFSVAAFGGAKARDLANGGNMVVDLANQARQNSISQNVMTAMVLAKDPGTDTYRLFRLMQLKPGGSWTYASNWVVLPQGISVDESTANSSFLDTDAKPTLSTALPTIKYNGASVSSYVYQIFMPKGRMSSTGMTVLTSPSLRIVRGTEGSNPQNYYDITLNLYTGIPKVDRP